MCLSDVSARSDVTVLNHRTLISVCTEHLDSQTGVIKNIHFINLSCFSNVTGKCYLAFCDLHFAVKLYMCAISCRQFVLRYVTCKGRTLVI